MVARADYEIKQITDGLSPGDWEWLCAFEDNLRDADRRELVAVAGDTLDAIFKSIEVSEEAYSVTGAGGEPLVLYGKCRVDNLPGRMIWCIATKALGPYQREFARVSRDILRRWADEYGILWNAVGDFNEPAKRWLQWCGADFGEPMEINGEKFVRFYIRGGMEDV